MVDNSQGHAAYASDALLAQNMNLNPGGKQARLKDGWYIGPDRARVVQPMSFPADHAAHPNAPKGMKQVLLERGLWRRGLLMKCKDGCQALATDCCALRILKEQPDFKEQRSLVQETIESAGHLCIFLPKFHCELNFIEFFWGAVKKHLRENCDYTFTGLKANMPAALRSVSVATIRRWEHRMIRWMDAYRNNLDAKSAQQQVRAFSSRKYKSHRRVPEAVARSFDA